MKGKAKRGLLLFGVILFIIWTVWSINSRLRDETEHVENPSLADSIKRGKERARIKQDSARKVDSAYIVSTGGLKQTRNEIQINTSAIAHKRDSLRAILKARAYADSVRYAGHK